MFSKEDTHYQLFYISPYCFLIKNEGISWSTDLGMKGCPKHYDKCGEISCISLENIVCHKLVGVLKRFLIDN